jgi:hypothetical protein
VESNEYSPAAHGLMIFDGLYEGLFAFPQAYEKDAKNDGIKPSTMTEPRSNASTYVIAILFFYL